MIYLYIWLAFVFLNLGIWKLKNLDKLIDDNLRSSYSQYSDEEWATVKGISTFVFCLWGPLVTIPLLVVKTNDNF